MRARTHFNVKFKFNPDNLFEAQSLIMRREITGNRNLKQTLERILLKQLDYSLSIPMR